MAKIRAKQGAIPDHTLCEMIMDGRIIGAKQNHVNPASLNLPLSEEVWRIENFFLPQAGEKIYDLIRHKFHGRPHDFSHPLERGVRYLVRLKPKLKTSQEIYGFCNPRSTTGRTFLNVNVVCDGIPRYDTVPKGFTGDMWLLVRNDIFSCLVLEDDELVQLRLFHSDARLNQESIIKLYKQSPLFLSLQGELIDYEKLLVNDNDGSLVMTLSIPIGQAGWRTKFTNRPVKFSKENKASDFFEPAISTDGTLTLDNRTGLILPTKEIIRVPNNIAAEGVRVDDRAGAWDSHRAGYIDTGFEGTITLEITGSDETIRDGTSALKVKFERTASPVVKPYTKGYSGQVTALLGRNFVF